MYHGVCAILTSSWLARIRKGQETVGLDLRALANWLPHISDRVTPL